MTLAPSSRRSAANSFDCSSGLVITMPLPNSGFFSNQPRRSLKPTTSPTTNTAGGENSLSFARAAIPPSFPVSVSWSGVVPHLISATGVSGLLPFSMRLEAILERFLTPIRNTMVSMADIFFQSMRLSALSGSSCPVTKASVEVNSLCVRGIPA